MNNLLDYKWINTRGGCVGVVLTENDYEQKAYMCVVQGNEEKLDIEYVKNWGVTLSFEIAQAYFPRLFDANKYVK
jgi:hypothetical protein